jgi:hypothetical protein
VPGGTPRSRCAQHCGLWEGGGRRSGRQHGVFQFVEDVVGDDVASVRRLRSTAPARDSPLLKRTDSRLRFTERPPLFQVVVARRSLHYRSFCNRLAFPNADEGVPARPRFRPRIARSCSALRSLRALFQLKRRPSRHPRHPRQYLTHVSDQSGELISAKAVLGRRVFSRHNGIDSTFLP